MNYGLGRRPAPDPRDANYPLRALLTAVEAAPPRPWRYWRDGPLLDQGQTGRCVAFAFRNWLNAAPIMDKPAVGPDPNAIYDAAIKIDEFPDNDNDPQRQKGTSVRAGAKVLQSLGYVVNYHWAANVDEAFTWLLTGGTIIAGTVWTTDMFTPTKQGFLKPTGSVAGGHAYLLDGANQTRGAIRMYNSWGNWGRKGHAWIAGEDLQTLVAQQGELCVAVEQRLAKLLALGTARQEVV